MEQSVHGAGAGTSAAAPPPLTPKQAAKFFEYFKPGTRRRVVLLGDLLPRRVHFVRSLNYKLLCTAQLGDCELCQKAPSSADISVAHGECVAPAGVQQKDRAYHQRVAVFTDAMGEALDELIAEGPDRGHGFELFRDTTQKFKLTPDKRSAGALAHALPPSFDVLPFIRARYGLPQEPGRPLVFIQPFTLRELTGPTRKRPALELSATDIRTAEEWEKTKAALDKMREFKETLQTPDAEPAPAQPAPQQQPREKIILVPVPNSPDPAYNPPVSDEEKRRIVNDSDAPTALRKRYKAELAARQNALQNNTRAAREAANGTHDRIAEAGQVLDETLAIIVPSTNGKHSDKNGGAR